MSLIEMAAVSRAEAKPGVSTHWRFMVFPSTFGDWMPTVTLSSLCPGTVNSLAAMAFVVWTGGVGVSDSPDGACVVADAEETSLGEALDGPLEWTRCSRLGRRAQV